MKRYIVLIVIFLFTRLSMLMPAFEEDNVSVRATSLGGALSSLSDDVSTIFYNPASTGFIAPDSSIKLNFQYANKYGIDNYNLYSGNLMFPKFTLFKLKTGFSYIYEGISDVISEKRFKLSFGTGSIALPPFTYISKTLQTGTGFSINYYSLSAAGYQYDEKDPAIQDKSGFGLDWGLLAIHDNLQIGFVLKNIMLSKFTDDIFGLRCGISYNFPTAGSLITLDFEPVKGINNYDRGWIKIGSINIGQGVYPLFHIGIEKIVKKILFLRIGLKDFKINSGIGVKTKSLITEYSFSSENVGNTHRLGITKW